MTQDATSVGRAAAAIGLDVVALIALCGIWALLATVPLIVTAAVPPLFLIFLAIALAGPGASWAWAAPRWGAIGTPRRVIGPAVASGAVSAAIAPMAAWLFGGEGASTGAYAMWGLLCFAALQSGFWLFNIANTEGTWGR